MADANESKAPPKPTVEDAPDEETLERRESQTASEWVDSQLKLEADAREAMPYSFDNCTRPLGSMRQNVFACLTCHPPPKSSTDTFEPAGICYACSIACHGEHTLVEIFARRHFTCDCGTTRFSEASPCTLRVNPDTGKKGEAHSEEPASTNDYNQNFQNRFCGCSDWYVAEEQKGTMYQCLGLVSEANGGCGEDWWHPECLLGLPREWYKSVEANRDPQQGDAGEDHPIPPGFPDEDDFEILICYKCVQATPWLKPYANSQGFMPLHYKKHEQEDADAQAIEKDSAMKIESTTQPPQEASLLSVPTSAIKRKADDEMSTSSKRARVEADNDNAISTDAKHTQLPAAPSGTFSMLATEPDFRERFCRCSSCYPLLQPLPQLLEEEEIYQPPVSEDGDGGSVGTGSILDRGEAALNTMDRVRAIEGVMAYNHLKDKVKTFLQPFAESGRTVGAADVEAYFAKLRGDQDAIREAGRAAAAERERNGDGSGGDGGHNGDTGASGNQQEQSGY